MSLFGAVLTFALLSAPPTEAADSSYVAAVYEHRVVLNPEPRVPLSRLEALQHLQKNLDIYEGQAARAAQQVLAAHDGWTLSRVTSFSTQHCVLYIYLPVNLSVIAAIVVIMQKWTDLSPQY